jgi:alkanesulfonate monooxygenase SsuD/methylene tetrahydromethanopterin reductase-like flavin-dependent oxidoreductase (luciferase family)
VFGLGVGPREADFAVTHSVWGDRGRRFEAQLAVMRKVWSGEAPYEGTTPVGPTLPSGRPEVIIGGFADVALRRAGRLADGIRSFDFAPDISLHAQRYAVVREAWNAAGRPGKPRIIASTYFSLGPGARETYETGMREYYGYDADTRQWAMTDTALTTPTAIRDAVSRFEDAGIDEMVFATALPLGPESWERLAEAIGR